jgi:acyl-CoA reductase-like NAD-dependent aldehyde dehydrogenase
MLGIPILRQGEQYRSLDIVRVQHHRTGEPFVEISQANPGLIRRDLLNQKAARQSLAGLGSEELLRICGRAADHFLNDSLALGEDQQSPQDYIEQVSATTGLPYVLARRNMRKIHSVLANMESVVTGLTRGLDLAILDRGFGEIGGHAVSFYPRTNALGVVLPSNSPGVHSLWVPSIALKTPLVLKPGSAEPWTPYRIIQALIRAGCPGEACCYYPTDHAGSGEILRNCGRGMVFGDSVSTGKWRDDPRIEVHGPGYSKIVIGEDCIEHWREYLDVIVASIVDNGGRSCVNASGIWVPSRGAEIAEVVAGRLGQILPRAADDERAQLAPFADPGVAARISGLVDQGLGQGGAREVTSKYRGTERLLSWQGCSYLLPTVVHCDSSDHPLANREFLFPFASVVEVNQSDIPEVLGPSLVVTAITADDALIGKLVASPIVDRLNVGAIPTNQVSWDQPHEGNLFEHLYARRAFQKAGAA